MSDSSSSSPSDAAETPSHHSQYRLRVTAGPTYDVTTHKLVPVNSPQTLTFENEHIILSLAVRIRRFTGFPKSSPETSPYFSHPLHKSDQYSIAFSIIPKVDIPGDDLVFGNDFDRPIRDRLPPGFGSAFNWVKWWIDPGLFGDVYADRPYLYGPALSSWNVLKIGEKVIDSRNLKGNEAWKMPNASSFHEIVVEEGAEGDGVDIRRNLQIPADSAARRKFYLTESNRKAFNFEAGRLYQSDFGNPYLDFNDFSLKLPIFTVNVIQYVDSKTHELRYTLKNKSTDEVYAVVLFTLLFGDELKAYDKEAEGTNAQQPGNENSQTTVDTNDVPSDDDDID